MAAQEGLGGNLLPVEDSPSTGREQRQRWRDLQSAVKYSAFLRVWRMGVQALFLTPQWGQHYSLLPVAPPTPPLLRTSLLPTAFLVPPLPVTLHPALLPLIPSEHPLLPKSISPPTAPTSAPLLTFVCCLSHFCAPHARPSPAPPNPLHAPLPPPIQCLTAGQRDLHSK